MTFYEDRTEFLRCECHCPEHIVVVSVYDNSLDKETLPPDLCIETQANQWRPFYSRIWTAIKYIFGSKLEWDSTIVHKEDIPKLKAAIAHYEFLSQNYDKKTLDKTNT